MEISCVHDTISFIENNYSKQISIKELENVSY